MGLAAPSNVGIDLTGTITTIAMHHIAIGGLGRRLLLLAVVADKLLRLLLQDLLIVYSIAPAHLFVLTVHHHLRVRNMVRCLLHAHGAHVARILHTALFVYDILLKA